MLTKGDKNKIKPKLRGVSHIIAFFASLITGWRLIQLADNDIIFQVSLYALSTSAVFGASGLLHFPTWPTPVYKILRKVDHCMVFFLIASTFNMISILPGSGRLVIYLGWIGAVVGVSFKLIFFKLVERGPKFVTSLPYLALGWACLFEVPNIAYYVELFGYQFVLLAICGGLIISYGALCYTFRKPNPLPGVFGYHEVLHLCVIVSVYLFYGCGDMIIQHYLRSKVVGELL